MSLSFNAYIESKEMTYDEVCRNFIKIHSGEHNHNPRVCPNCGDTCNYREYPAESWTAIGHCIKCGMLTVTHIQDRMSGVTVDAHEVFSDK